VSKSEAKTYKTKTNTMQTKQYIEYLENKVQSLEQSQAELFVETEKLRKLVDQGKQLVLKLIARMNDLTTSAYGGLN